MLNADLTVSPSPGGEVDTRCSGSQRKILSYIIPTKWDVVSVPNTLALPGRHLRVMDRERWRNIAGILLKVAFWIIWFCLFITGGIIHGAYTVITEDKQYTPRPVFTTGRRRLSITSRSSSSGLWALSNTLPYTIDQSRFSYLFSRLSPELRLMIYKEVLGNHIIHIGLCPGRSRKERGRMAHIRCHWEIDDGRRRWRYHNCKLRNISKDSDNRVFELSYQPSLPHDPSTKGLLSLLKTCRQMYVLISMFHINPYLSIRFKK